MAGVNYRAIYKCTTLDPIGTIKHATEKGVEIVRPKRTFLQIVEKEGMPTRRCRHCCKYLKEYKILDTSIQGIRRCESSKRKNNYSEDNPIICRIYGRSKKNHVNVILPILSWTNKDVEDFITERGIKCHPLYYDENGRFHVERRLGCVGCPLQGDNGRGDYRSHPKLFRQVVKRVLKWWNTHPNAKSRSKFGSPYALTSHNLFYNKYEDFCIADNNPFEGKRDWKATLEEFFKIKLD